MSLIESIPRYFYAATLSIDPDGGLLLASSRERILTWGLTFCIIALISFILWQLKIAKRTSCGVFFATLLIPLLVIPSLKHEQIHVTGDQIFIRSGYWFYPITDIIDLSGLEHIRQEVKPFALAKLIGKEDIIWNIHHKDGQENVLDLNGFFTDHRKTVAVYLRDHGQTVNFLPYLDCMAEC